MKPLNRKDRIKAFGSFFFMFLVTVVLIVVAIFFNFKVPKKENTLLKTDNKALRAEYDYQVHFTGNLHDIKNNLDSINLEGQNVYYLDQLVSRRLASLKESVPQESDVELKQLYDEVIQISLSLQSSKRELRDLQNMKDMVEGYEEQIKLYKDELDQVKRDLDICRQLSGVNR